MRALCALLALLAVLPLYAANAEETFKPNVRDIPAELAPIPEEYAIPARYPGLLVSLEYDTWKSFSYAKHCQPLRKTAQVYLPYCNDATRP